MRATRWNGLWMSLTLLAALAASACAEPLIYIDPPVTEVWTGSDCWVDVSVNDEVLGLTGYDVEIDYDEGVVELLDVVEGELPPSSGGSFFYWTSGPAPEHAIVINGAVLGDSVDGPGTLARLHFSALTPGVSPVEFIYFELRDLQNDPIAVSDVGGQVVVAGEPTIYLTPAETTVTEGTTFTVDVAINESLTDLTGYNLRITLDSTHVHFLGATEGPLPPSGGDDTYFYWILQDANTMIINGAVLGGWVDGPGVLAHITLLAVLQGTTDMDFISVELRDINNDPLTAIDEGAVITVEPGGSPAESTSWSAIKSLFR